MNTSATQIEKEIQKSMAKITLSLGLIAGAFFAVTGIHQTWLNSPEGKATTRKNECIARLRSSLRDPGSLNVLGFDGVSMEYTAKNGFGGRVRKTTYC